MISMIAAIGRNRELGKGNELLWRIPEDLKRFRALTRGHPVIMGRKTFESIGKPLPERTNIVVTREGEPYRDEAGFHFWDAKLEKDGCVRVSDLEGAILFAKKHAPGSDEIFIIGGAQIYALALPHADKLYLTRIDAEASDADAFFPEYPGFTKVVAEQIGSHDGLGYTWVDLIRS